MKVVVELPERGRGRVVLDFADGAGAAAVAVVAMDGWALRTQAHS